MDLVNATRMAAAWTVALDPSGREHVVVVVKGTFLFPEVDGAPAELADEQVPPVMADTFTGAPGFSAPVYEADFPLRKPRCDVLLNATAHAPEGRPAQRVRVGVKLGAWSKIIDVVGDRLWRQAGPVPGPEAPQPFLTMPITYDRAFGGMDDTNPELGRRLPPQSRRQRLWPRPIGRAASRPPTPQHRGAGRSREAARGAAIGP